MAAISDSGSQWWECQRKTGVCSMCEVPCVHTQLRTSPRAAQGLSPARIDLRGKFTWRIGLRVQRKGCLCAHLPQKVSLLPGQGSETEKKRFLCDTPLPLIFLQVLGTLLRMPLIWNENKNGVSLPSEPFLQNQSHLVLAGAIIHEHFQQFQMEELPFSMGDSFWSQHYQATMRSGDTMGNFRWRESQSRDAAELECSQSSVKGLHSQGSFERQQLSGEAQ